MARAMGTLRTTHQRPLSSHVTIHLRCSELCRCHSRRRGLRVLMAVGGSRNCAEHVKNQLDDGAAVAGLRSVVDHRETVAMLSTHRV